MGLAAFWSSGSREDLKGFLPYFGMAAFWSLDNEISEYDQESSRPTHYIMKKSHLTFTVTRYP